jgi:hypothetical protein
MHGYSWLLVMVVGVLWVRTTSAQPRDPQWVSTLSGPGHDFVRDIATGPDGSIIVTTLDTRFATPQARRPISISKYDLNGNRLWIRSYPNDSVTRFFSDRSTAISDQGNIYLAVNAECGEESCGPTIDFGGGPTSVSVLVKLAPDGSFLWQSELSERDWAGQLAVDHDENAYLVGWQPWWLADRSSLEKFSAAGDRLWSSPQYWLATVTTDGGNNVVVGGSLHGPGYITKLSSEGDVLWNRRVEGSEGIAQVSTTLSGTVFATGNYINSVTWGSTVLPRPSEASTFLLTADPDGQPGWIQRISRALSYSLAADARGNAFVATTAIRSLDTPSISVYNPAGVRRFDRNLWTMSELGPDWAAITALRAASDGSVVVGGSFSGLGDFGTGAPGSQYADGFLLDLQP